MKKYGLQLRGRPPVAPPVVKKPSIFNEDEDEEDVEQTLAREAARKRALKEVESQHKAALEQDSTVFDYDGCYDAMKANAAAPRIEDRVKEKPKYITSLVEKAKFRKMEQEIVYERKLLKERQQEDHLYGDKEKYVTAAYKKKLAELEKWNEEERRRRMREEADDVTKKSDLGDFYRNLLSKNVAFGASARERKLNDVSDPELAPSKSSEKSPEMREKLLTRDTEIQEALPTPDTGVVKESGEVSPKQASETNQINPLESTGIGQGATTEKTDRRPSEDTISAAKERYLARKRLRTT